MRGRMVRHLTDSLISVDAIVVSLLGGEEREAKVPQDSPAPKYDQVKNQHRRRIYRNLNIIWGGIEPPPRNRETDKQLGIRKVLYREGEKRGSGRVPSEFESLIGRKRAEPKIGGGRPTLLFEQIQRKEG